MIERLWRDGPEDPPGERDFSSFLLVCSLSQDEDEGDLQARACTLGRWEAEIYCILANRMINVINIIPGRRTHQVKGTSPPLPLPLPLPLGLLPVTVRAAGGSGGCSSWCNRLVGWWRRTYQLDGPD